MSYSGQCLTSEALGGRSANRGACAQACRLPYELIVDGEKRELGDRKYLISPQDLAAHDLVPELIGLVDSLKIEGRLKTPEYVAATTRAYRKAVDQPLTTEEVRTLQQVFSRGFSHGFLGGINHQVLVKGLSPKKRGVYLGEVAGVRGSRVSVKLLAPLKPGDGIVFDYGHPEDDEPGGRVMHVWKRGVRVEAADGETVEFEVRECPPPQVGWRVWKTDDPAVNRELRASFEKTRKRFRVSSKVEQIGDRLRISFDDVSTEIPCQVAVKRPLTVEYLREHLGRLGDTPFELGDLDVRIGNVMAPVSQINEARRKLAAELIERRRKNPGHRIRPVEPRVEVGRTAGEPRLVVLCRSLEQVRVAVEEGIRDIECDFEDIRKYREVPPECFLAPPRIHKPGENGILKNVGPNVLVRSTAHLAMPGRKVGDFSLNIANEWTAEWWLSKGLERFVPSYDLNWEQLQALLARTDAGRAEVTVHQHMPMFHNEHCVFAAILSNGRDSTDCGRPCDRHRVELRDRVGKSHPVKADVGCRNTIYNAVPQSASPYMRGMRDLGVRWFRVELLLHPPDEARRLIRAYRDVIDGRNDGQTLWREMNALNFMGVTRGPLGRTE